jgi:hypothetical protein
MSQIGQKQLDSSVLSFELFLESIGAIAVVTNFRRNCAGFWRSYRWLILLLSVGLLCDAVSTIGFMEELGIEAELNPSVRALSYTFGTTAGPLLGAVLKAGVCCVICVYYRRFAPHMFCCATFAYFFAAWFNVWGIHLTAHYFCG